MSRKDERDLERPHYYSQFWINQAREAAGQPISFSNGDAALASVLDRDEEDDDDLLTLPVQKAPPTLESALEDFDALVLPPAPAPKPPKQKNPTAQRPASLSSFADLAALGFGADTETGDFAVGADDDADDIMSRIESEFEMSKDVEPDEEEAASLESLSEEENGLWEEEAEDDDTLPRRPVGPRPKIPPRRPQRRDF
jgi:hypothetical protein